MSYVSFRPIGRLGNLMFETAACIGYAKQHGFKWLVPTNRAGGDNDPYLLPTFWPNLPYGNFQGTRYQQHDPKDFNYKPIPYFANGVTLVGFFQSLKWFENAQDEVKAAFTLNDYTEYRDYVSIHVRRGDYVTNANSFPPITMEYIWKAINELKKAGVDSNKFLVFSDDIEWCKQNVKSTLNSHMEFEYNEDTNEYEAISKMASCGHHIIANSTFSFWGAYLGKNPDKIVISPSIYNWFGPGFTGGPPIDLIPDSWIQIRI